MRTPHDFAQRRVFKVRQAGSMLALRHKQIPKALLPGLRFQFLDYRIDLPRPQFFRLLIELHFVRVDVAVHKRLQMTFKLDDLVGLGIEHRDFQFWVGGTNLWARLRAAWPLDNQWIAAYMIFSSVASDAAISSTMRPPLATRIRSEIARTSGRYDDMTMTALPSAASARIAAWSCGMAPTSTP